MFSELCHWQQVAVKVAPGCWTVEVTCCQVLDPNLLTTFEVKLKGS